MQNTAIDTTGWTVYEPAQCECVSAKQAKIDTPGGQKPIFILELLTDDGKEIIKYLNVKKLPSGNYSAAKESDFAKLYRLAIGDNPTKRFSKAQQLLGHFHGVKFIVSFEEHKSSNNTLYFKAKTIQPVEPIIRDEWTATGQVKGKPRGHYKRQKQAKPRLLIGDDMATSRRNSGEDLDIEKPVKSQFNLTSSTNSVPLKHTTYNMKPLTHNAVIRDKEGQIIGAEYNRREHETVDAYYDRVINETFI
jgi:hypothetical protein